MGERLPGGALPPLLPRAAVIVAYVLAHQATIEQIGPFRLEISGGPPGAEPARDGKRSHVA